ncbi:microtubule-associated protein EB1 [Cavenderia fasciculata]|uniref:Microtubule-associated protein EB1 n=1 Tax=Cavenderia fasciculata TaxID=261658 RepID=F4QB20_CACFS|nr:microtubule-associated protein EB1 [Cavenderia fasciculata]EGG14792.1 microtubule-associated protein EB1 [Cavenderia fasciculata]|eukprot:XP_004351308.1 microtubule-associated protein EB1 [Cavenderia fasciculata]
MEGGRMEIINWLNDTLQLNYTKIEQTATGAAHCQIMDLLFPGKINLAKVNFNAKYDYEYVKNFGYLQEIFAKIAKIEKYHMDVDKMVTGRPQANLEFCQWMKKYFDSMNNGEPYNALERRVQSRCAYEGDKALIAALGPNAPKPPPAAPKTAAGGAGAKPSASALSKPSATKPVAAAAATVTKPVATTTVKKPAATVSKPVATTTTTTAARPSVSKPPATSTVTRPSITPAAKPQPTVFKPTTAAAKPKPSAPSPVPAAASTTTTQVIEQIKTVTIVDPELVKELEQTKEDNQRLLEENTKAKIQVEEVERDRDFFYEKLRDVEIFCQDNIKLEGTAEEAIAQILAILYKNAENDGEEEELLEEEPAVQVEIVDGDGDDEQQEEQQEEQEEELIQEDEQEEENIQEDDEDAIMNKLQQEDEIIDDDLVIDDEVLEEMDEF